MSSESHHVFLTSTVAVPQTAISTSANQIQRMRCRIIAAEKYAYGNATISVEVDGHCGGTVCVFFGGDDAAAHALDLVCACAYRGLRNGDGARQENVVGFR